MTATLEHKIIGKLITKELKRVFPNIEKLKIKVFPLACKYRMEIYYKKTIYSENEIMAIAAPILNAAVPGWEKKEI